MVFEDRELLLCLLIDLGADLGSVGEFKGNGPEMAGSECTSAWKSAAHPHLVF